MKKSTIVVTKKTWEVIMSRRKTVNRKIVCHHQRLNRATSPKMQTLLKRLRTLNNKYCVRTQTLTKEYSSVLVSIKASKTGKPCGS